MKKQLIHLFLMLIFFIGIPVIKQSMAASLSFDKSTVSVSNGATFQIAVTVNPSGDAITSTDVYVTYDSTALKANSVAAGSLFPTVTNDIATSGKVYIAGLVNDAATSVSTTGTLATITFQALKEATVTLTFDCTKSKIVKNDVNITNVLVCADNGSSTVTIGSGGSSSSTTPTIAPTSGTLPQSGVFDNVVKFAIPGMILLFLGGMLRFAR